MFLSTIGCFRNFRGQLWFKELIDRMVTQLESALTIKTILLVINGKIPDPISYQRSLTVMSSSTARKTDMLYY